MRDFQIETKRRIFAEYWINIQFTQKILNGKYCFVSSYRMSDLYWIIYDFFT